jgi:hypothetical protein
MRSYGALLTLIFASGLGTVMAVPAAPAVDQTKINQLITQLGSDNFRQRDAANKELDAIGEPALEALRKAAKSNDMEIANRAAALVGKIEQRAENAKLLAPTYVELTFKETPVAEAVAELAKKSGFQVVLGGDQTNLADRRVTLETGRVPFWKALEMLCEKANLVESDGTINPAVDVPTPLPPVRIQPAQPLPIKPINVKPLPPVQIEKPQRDVKPPEGFSADAPPAKEAPAKPEQKPEPAPAPAQPVQIQVQIQLQPAQPALPIRRGPVGAPGFNGGAIVLVDGKHTPVPSQVEGAIRIRAVNNQNLLANFGSVADGEIGVLFEVRPELRIQVQQLLGVNVDRAQDNLDQILTPITVSNNVIGPNTLPVLKGQLAQPAIARPYPGNGYYGVGANYIPVRLKKADKEAKSLKELRGTVSMKIRTPVEEIAAVEKVLKAKGEAVKGKGDATMKIIDVVKEENGDIKVEVEMKFSNEIQPNAQAVQFNGQPQPQPLPGVRPQLAPAIQPVPPQGAPGGGFGTAVVVHNYLGLELLDAKGVAIPLLQMANNRNQWQANVRTAVATLVFRPAKEQAEAEKLVFMGTRLAAVEVPFLLKDVPVK